MKLWFQKAVACLAAVSTITFCAAPLSAPVSAAWVNNGGSWSYTSGSRNLTGWQKIDGVWYYFNSSGIMQTGWQKIGGVWYYMNASGAMQTGWRQIGGVWYLNPGSISIPKEGSARGYVTLDASGFQWKTLQGETYDALPLEALQ